MNLIYVGKLQWPRDFNFSINITERLARWLNSLRVLASIPLVLSALFSVITTVKKIAIKVTE